ncbi:MAG: site-specific DNA-methyltransferase, partial [Anaerolineae bacterium]|nr:site-specific DNA-methyltransferase [Anaerolineae bacterium]
GVRFTNAHEPISWASKSKGADYTFNHHALKALNDDLQMRSDWTLPICSGPERVRVNGKKAHSTQKPLALLYRVLLASTNAGDVVLDPFFGSGTTGAAARLLGRRWIGIEREEKYIAIAEERIRAVEPLPLEALTLPRNKRRQRVPFGSLLEAGLLRAGQTLFFDRDPQRSAAIRVDGRLAVNGFSGSIHQAAVHLLGHQPANGWEHWYFQDEKGELRSIGELREHLITAP